jgi:GMP synthase (glutamine-hydrolysing)
MILIIDCCSGRESLSYDEFVRPVLGIAMERDACAARHISQVEGNDLLSADGIIICGTALMDNDFLKHARRFIALKRLEKPVLGICAGMQIISKVFGGGIERLQEIGMTRIRVVKKDPLFSGKREFGAYSLHNLCAKLPPSFTELARSSGCLQAFRHDMKPVYGVLFHPEVRNRWIIDNFLKMQL